MNWHFHTRITTFTAPLASTLVALCAWLFATTAHAENLAVKITPSLASVTVKHENKDGKTSEVKIMRNQDQKNRISDAYALTSRKCPPFCIQPMDQFAPHQVEVIDEIGILSYLQAMQDSDDYILIDSRTTDWIFLKSGTIPGAINIPWTRLNANKGATDEQIKDILEGEFNVVASETGPWDFKEAKTLVLFCNGMWCGQSPTNIRALLALGYPAAKIKWYRSGMQTWETLGLTTVKSARVVK